MTFQFSRKVVIASYTAILRMDAVIYIEKAFL